MAYIGAIEPFTGTDFQPYQERIEAYFEANDIGVIAADASEAAIRNADRKKVQHLIAVIGKETYGILKDCCLPEKPSEKNFAEVWKILQDYYRPS